MDMELMEPTTNEAASDKSTPTQQMKRVRITSTPFSPLHSMLGNKYVVNRAHDHSFFKTIEKGIDWGTRRRPRGNTCRDFHEHRGAANITPQKNASS